MAEHEPSTFGALVGVVIVVVVMLTVITAVHVMLPFIGVGM